VIDVENGVSDAISDLKIKIGNLIQNWSSFLFKILIDFGFQI